MPPPRPLRRDPIHEAIIDIRTTGTTLTSAVEVTSAVSSALSTRFPRREEKRKAESRIEFKEGKVFASTSQDSGFFGLFLKSEDEKDIAQFRRDGFTLNRLRPYTGWANVFPLALELWDAYIEIARPQQVTRLALRYVNRLEVTLEAGPDFSLYLRSAPIVPDELPQTVSGFQTRITLVRPEDEVMANVVQSLEHADKHRMVVLLDIDVFQTAPVAPHRDAIAPVLQSLHDFKNQVFFESVTENTLRFYE